MAPIPKRQANRAENFAGSDITVEVIRVMPGLLWFIFALVLTAFFYHPLMKRLEGGDISKVSVAAFQIEFVRSEFMKADATAFATPAHFAAYGDRIQRNAAKIYGARGLWVDEGDPVRNFKERRALAALGISFDLAKTNEEARRLFDAASDKGESPYDFIITNIGRGVADPAVAPCFPKLSARYREAGCKLIQIVHELYQANPPPIIIYSSDSEVYGTPAGALGGTDRFDELAELVLDAVERRDSLGE